MQTFVSLFFFASGYLLLQFSTNHWKHRAFIAVSGVLFILLSLTEVISRNLTGSGFNEAVVYHLSYGLSGAGFVQFYPLIIKSILGIVSLIALLIFAVYRSPLVTLKKTIGNQRILGLLIYVFGAVAIVSHPIVHAMSQYVIPDHANFSMVDFFVPPKGLSTLDKPPNIVWIYAESLERSYMDATIFPGLVPYLEDLERESVSFTNVRQHWGTGWTIAGIVASQCGVPLVTMGGEGNGMQSIPKFLPGATCFGDLLRDKGYYLSYMAGGEKNFAGKASFLATHGYHEVLGFEDLAGRLTDASYVSDWGIHDDTLFDFVNEKIIELNKMNKPFVLTTLTLDTHHPLGYFAKACRGRPYGDGENSILNAVHCTDRLIGELVKKLRSSDFMDNTVVVVSSDHLAMNNVAHGLLEKTDRRNLLLVNWPSRLKAARYDRVGDTFSSGVTVLNLMGFEIQSLGLGRALNLSTPSLAEKYQNADQLLPQWIGDFRKLWLLPEMVNKIVVNPKFDLLFIGRNAYHLPAIVNYKKQKINELLLYDTSNKQYLTDRIDDSGKNGDQIWIDGCQVIGEKLRLSSGGNSSKWCAWSSISKKISPITASLEIGLKDRF